MGRSLISVRRHRRRRRVAFRLHEQHWQDPFPWIPGTEPEKRIFEALVRRGIYFRFQDDFPIEDRYVSALLQTRHFKPDIIVPEWKVIYDPFSEFHHSQPDAIRADAWKSVEYRAKGYEFIHPWSKDVAEKGGDWAVSLSTRITGPPLFKLDAEDQKWKTLQGYKLGPNLGLGASSVGIANRKRAKHKAPLLRTTRR